MDINAITSTVNTYTTVTNLKNSDETVIEEEITTGNDSEEQVISQSIETASDGAQKTKGVLRLLQEGHFKGVSDVRLRINFHEEIQALENQKLIESADTGVTEMISSISTGMAELLESENPEPEISAIISEAVEALGNELKNISSEFINNDDSEITNLSGALQSTFNSFMEPHIVVPSEETPEEPQLAKNIQVQSPSIQPDDIESDTIEEIPAETTIDSNQTIQQQFWAALQELFASELENLNSQLSSISVLPEISEPSGNGKAYDKFLNIYNNMNITVQPNPEPQIVNESV